MRKLTQTRLHNPPTRGNCFPTVIACFLDLESPEDAIQIQEHYDEDDWNVKLYNWLLEKGWQWSVGDGHLFNDEFYLVSGESPRNSKVTHVCIYQNGELYHDPHPDKTGIVTEAHFERIKKLEIEVK